MWTLRNAALRRTRHLDDGRPPAIDDADVGDAGDDEGRGEFDGGSLRGRNDGEEAAGRERRVCVWEERVEEDVLEAAELEADEPAEAEAEVAASESSESADDKS